MKKIQFLLLASIAVAFSGCTTTTPSPLTKAFIRVTTSTTIALSIKKETNTIPYLRAVMPIVCSASEGTSVSPQEVVLALEQSDAQELKTVEGVIAINAVLALYSAAFEQYGGGANTVVARSYLESICEGMRDVLVRPGLRQTKPYPPHVK